MSLRTVVVGGAIMMSGLVVMSSSVVLGGNTVLGRSVLPLVRVTLLGWALVGRVERLVLAHRVLSARLANRDARAVPVEDMEVVLLARHLPARDAEQHALGVLCGRREAEDEALAVPIGLALQVAEVSRDGVGPCEGREVA